MVNVGRQRHLPELVENLLKDALVGEAHKAVAVLGLPHNFADEFSLAEADLRADRALSAGLYESLPGSVLFSCEEQHFDFRAGADLLADEARRNYLCVVQDQAVAGLQVLCNVPEMSVLNLAALPVQHHEPRGSSVLERILRNQLLRQLVVKIF